MTLIDDLVDVATEIYTALTATWRIANIAKPVFEVNRDEPIQEVRHITLIPDEAKPGSKVGIGTGIAYLNSDTVFLYIYEGSKTDLSKSIKEVYYAITQINNAYKIYSIPQREIHVTEEVLYYAILTVKREHLYVVS